MVRLPAPSSAKGRFPIDSLRYSFAAPLARQRSEQ